jgi:CBS domain-containing protein
MTATVRDILEEKGYQVWSVSPETTIYETLRLMAEQKIGFVPVLKKGKIAGIYSERDFARLMAARSDVTLTTPVGEVMVNPVYFVKPEQTVQDCIQVMTAMHFRHLPVIVNEKVIGVISIGDVVKRIMLEKDYTIEQLENLLWANLV